MGRRESFHVLNSFMSLQNCPRLDSIFYGIFHPPTHTHTAPTLFLGGLDAGDSCVRIIVPAVEGNREISENRCFHTVVALKKKEQFLKHIAIYRIHMSDWCEWHISDSSLFFSVEKAHFGKACFCLLSVKSGKRFALLLTTTKPSCDTCFSVELHGPTGIVESEEDVSDVRLSIHTSPLLCCCSRVKDLPSFLWTACSRQEGHSASQRWP